MSGPADHRGTRHRHSARRERMATQLSTLRGSDIAKAGGLAGAMIANNVIALGSTVVFARELSDYGALAALISYFLILGVAGQALQVATAREGVLGRLGVGPGLLVTLRAWARTLAWVTALLTVVSVLLRAPIASAVGVSHDSWAAALGLPAGCLWLGLSILRGALQGVGDYRTVGLSLVGEQGVRLVVGAALAGIGLGVTGAYLGTPLSFVAVSVYSVVHLRRYARDYADTDVARTGGPAGFTRPAAGIMGEPAAVAGEQAGLMGEPAVLAGEPAPFTGAPVTPGGQGPATREATISLWTHVRRAWAPIAGLIVIAVLQNIDIIAAKHRFTGVPNLASSYAATAVAAKVLVWVAIGAGFYLVPETSRRRAEGLDTRPVLARALAIILVCAVPVLLIFGVGARPLLRAAFGANRLEATGSLLILGIAFTMLAATYLAIQYLLALKRTWFLVAIGAVAVAEPILLLQASRRPDGFAAVVLCVQAAGALVAFAFALRRDGRPPPRVDTPTVAPETVSA